jgi:hypothetical protein
VPHTAVAIAFVAELAASLSSLCFVRFAPPPPVDTSAKRTYRPVAAAAAEVGLRDSVRREFVASRPGFLCEFPSDAATVVAPLEKS